MNLLRVAARVAALAQPLSERPDYGDSDTAVPRGDRTSQREETGVVKKTPGKDEWCVKSEKKDSDWSGGCYPSRGQAEKRLHQVEYFKHRK